MPDDVADLGSTDDLGITPTERFAQSRLPMGLLTLDGTIVAANAALGELHGCEPAEIVGASLLDVAADPADRARVEEALQAAVGEAGGAQLRVRVTRRSDGAQVPVLGTWSLIRRDDGSPWYLTSVVVDETERVAAEQALQAAERRWRTLLRRSADVTWTLDDTCAVTWVTSSVENVFGYAVEQLVGADLLSAVHPDDVAAVEQVCRDVVDGRVPQRVTEHRVRHADGTYRWVRMTLTDLRDDPDVGAVVGNAVDVTEVRAVADERAREALRYRARFEQSTVPQGMVDRAGTVTAVNAALCSLLGLPADELVGRSPLEVVHADDADEAAAALRQALTGELEAIQAEVRLTGRGGRRVPVLADITVLRAPDGSPDGAAGFVYDLSRLREAERRRQQQEDFFLTLSTRATDLAIVVDAEGRLIYVSPAARHLLGYEPAEVTAELAWGFVHDEDVPLAEKALADVLSDGGSRTVEIRVRASDGTWRWFEDTLTNALDTAVGGVVCNLRDVTDRVVAEAALRRSEARYRAIAETAHEGIWVATVDGTTLFANQRMADMLGRPLDDLYQRTAVELVGAEQAAQLDRRRADRARRGAERYEVVYHHPDGDERVLHVSAAPLRLDDGTVEGSLAMVSDVTQERRAEAELRRSALHDTLTGLPNRTLLLDRLEHALARETVGTAALFLDLDQFKLVNDSSGHAVGDELLVAVANRLAEVVRPGDTAARFGGDEFVVVCEDVDEDEALRLAEELLAEISQPYQLAERLVNVRASVGVAVSPSASAGDLLRWADTAMYAAKAAGRGRVQLYDGALSQEAEQRFLVARELQAALASDELDMHYQPVVDVRTGRVLGVEALARWHSPRLGSVPPTRFVPVAELTGLGHELDAFAVRHALRDAALLRSWGALPDDAYVAVNVSARSLSDDGLERLVVEACEETGCLPHQVVLEITETAIVEDAQRASGVLGRLRERGFGVVVDDFGTGYSSLAYLRDLPISGLKIDRHFIAGIEGDADALAIVASVVDLARAVGVGVVAEGVETAEQAALLRKLGCPAAQGWLWSRALPVERVRGADWRTGFEAPERREATAPRTRRTAAPIGPEHGRDRLLELHGEGASLATIAAALNAEGFRTPEGVRWHRTTVARAVAAAAYPQLSSS